MIIIKRILIFLIATISFLIIGCDDTVKPLHHSQQEKAELQKYIQRIKSDLIFVQGGTFWMGDFCKKMRNGGPYCSPEKDTRPLHEVELSSYSISKFKVTHEDYNFYLKMQRLPEKKFKEDYEDSMYKTMTYFKGSPAIISWTEADKYCSWLKNISGIPFSLPTEAQWEYAARNRGEYVLVATDDGGWREQQNTGHGENYATDKDRQEVEDKTGLNGILIHFPVNKYPPTSFGLYGMSDNGYEWVKDWYDPEYYKYSSKKDPQGPEKAVVKDNRTGQYRKVRRGGNNPDPAGDVGLTFFRGYNTKDNDFPDGTTVRCVVNSQELIK
ncbi:formylglycine-generating enzyme family protein [Cronobacter dublinensis]